MRVAGADVLSAVGEVLTVVCVRYGDPILRIRFHENSGTVISADKHVIKIWDATTVRLTLCLPPRPVDGVSHVGAPTGQGRDQH